MASWFDETFFRRWFGEDPRLREEAWNALWTFAYRFALALLGRADNADHEQKAVTAATTIALRIRHALEADPTKWQGPTSFEAYVREAVRNALEDLRRAARRREAREVALDAPADDGDEESHLQPIDVLAHPGQTPLEMLVAAEERAAGHGAPEAAWDADEGEQRDVLLDWCEVPRTMLPWCAQRRVLAAMLEALAAYLRLRLPTAPRSPGSTSDATLHRRAAAADPESARRALNAFIQASLAINRETLDQRWADLRAIARAHHYVLPAGLQARGRSAPAARKTQRAKEPPANSAGGVASPAPIAERRPRLVKGPTSSELHRKSQRADCVNQAATAGAQYRASYSPGGG